MFTNKKQMEDILSSIKKLESRLDSLRDENAENNRNFFSELEKNSKTLDILKKKFTGLENKTNLIDKNLSEEIDKLSRTNEDFWKRTESFRLLEDWLRKKFIEETREEISSKMSFLDETEKQYNEFYEDLSSTRKNIAKAEEELKRFLDISKEIKKEDFELSRHAKNLEAEKRENLRLTRENEKLKTLISKERKRHQRR